MTRVLAVVLAAMMILSGCAGLGGDAVAPDAGSGSGSGGSGSSGGDGDSAGDGGSGADTGDDGVALGFEPAENFEDIQNERQMTDYIDRNPFPVYRPGEFYRYEGVSTMNEADELQSYDLTVESGDGGEWLEADLLVTVEREDGTVQNSDDTPGMVMFSEFGLMQNGRSWIWLYRFNFVTDRTPRISDLQLGDTWNYESPDSGGDDDAAVSGFDFAVTESRSYAGVDCLLVEVVSYEGDDRFLFSESCVAPDVGMPLYFAMYDNSGERTLEAELVEYSR